MPTLAADRLVGEQADVLDHVADVAPQLHRVGLHDVPPGHDDAPAGQVDEAVDHPQGGRLAAARGADEHADLALVDLEA